MTRDSNTTNAAIKIIFNELCLHYPVKSLHALIKLTNGKSMTKSRMVADGTVPVYGANGLIGATTCPLVLKPTITIGRVGSCGEINMTPAPAWITDNAMWISNISDKINQEYLYFALKGLPIAESAKIAAMPSISQNNVLSEGVPCPPLEDQVKIGRFLEEFSQGVSVDNCSPLPILIQHQRRTVARIEELAAKIEEAQKLRRQAAEEVEGLLAASIKRSFDNISIDGHLGDVLLEKPRNGWSAKCDNADTGIPVLTLTAVTGFQYRENEFKRTSEPTSPNAHYWLHDDDLLITRSNTPELVGHAAIYNGTPKPCIYSDLMMRLKIDTDQADKNFILWWLRNPKIREYIISNAKGSSPTMKKINQKIVMDIPYSLNVPIDEQRRIVARLDELQAQVDGLKKHQVRTAEELDALLPSVLDRAFRGQL